jgi:hypothetical protein
VDQWRCNGVASESVELKLREKYQWRYSREKNVSVALPWHGKWLIALQWCGKWSVALQCRGKCVSGVTMPWQDQWRYNGVESGSVALQWQILISMHWANTERHFANVTKCSLLGCVRLSIEVWDFSPLTMFGNSEVHGTAKSKNAYKFWSTTLKWSQLWNPTSTGEQHEPLRKWINLTHVPSPVISFQLRTT